MSMTPVKPKRGWLEEAIPKPAPEHPPRTGASPAETSDISRIAMSGSVERTALDAQVYAERLRLLAKQCRGLMVSGAVVSAALAASQWRVADHAGIIKWLVLLALADQLTFRCSGYWMRHFDDPSKNQQGIYHLLSALAATGLAWGLAPWMLYATGDFQDELVIILFLFGITMATVVLFSTFGVAILARAVTIWVPAIAHTLYLGDGLHLSLGIGYTAFAGFICVFGCRVSSEHVASLFRLYENRRLNELLVESQAELQRNNGALQSALQRIEELAVRDELTGAYNRRFLAERLEAVRSGSDTSSCRMAIALLDADHFKKINDAYGHHVGDEVLKFLSKEASSILRPGDLFARYGGEEFVCLLADADAEIASSVAERLRSWIAEQSPLRLQSGVRVTVSIGIAVYEPGESVKDWLHRADEALYSAKHQGRNRWTVAGPSSQAALQAANGLCHKAA